MIYEEMMYVKRLGVYSGVTVFVLYPNRSMLENLQGLGWKSWLEGLAKWFAKVIQSSSFFYKIATFSTPFPLPKTRFGKEEKKETLLLWARTLDDLIICRTRAYYSIREQSENILHNAPHIRIRTSDESINSKKSLFLNALKQELSRSIILSRSESLLEVKINNIILRGKPDLYLVSNINNLIRGLIIELHETDFRTIKKTLHIFPRVYMYALASYIRYGVIPISFSIPLSMTGEFAVMCMANIVYHKQKEPTYLHIPSISTLFSELNFIHTLIRAPQPYARSKVFCKECKYKNICEF